MITITQMYVFSFVITSDNEKMNEQQLFLTIGEWIRSVRIQKNMNQQDLAARCNFEQSNMSRIEAGRTNLTVRSLDRIARALDVKIRDLVDVE